MICWSFCLQCLTFFVEHQSKHSTFHQLINYTQDIFVIIFDFYNDRKEAIQENLLEVTKCTFFIIMYEMAPLRLPTLLSDSSRSVHTSLILSPPHSLNTLSLWARGSSTTPSAYSEQMYMNTQKKFCSHSVLHILYMEFTHVLLHSGLLGGICGPLHRG